MDIKTAFLFWFVMVVIAIANGFFAEKTLVPLLGDYGSHLYKTALIIAVIFAGSRIYVTRFMTEPNYSAALATGMQWLFSSIVFEFLFGHFVFGFPWERLFADYRIWQGRLWSLVLASEVAAPLFNVWIAKG